MRKSDRVVRTRFPERAGLLSGGSRSACAAVVASSFGGVAGFGTGAMMIPVIAWTLGPKATVPVLTVGMFIGNGARVWFSRDEIDYRVVGAYLAGRHSHRHRWAPCSTRRSRAQWISRLLGGFLLVAVPGRRWLEAHGMRVRLVHFPLIGGVFGFLSSLVGAVGPILSPFFLGYGLVRGAYVSTDALCTVGTYFTRGARLPPLSPDDGAHRDRGDLHRGHHDRGRVDRPPAPRPDDRADLPAPDRDSARALRPADAALPAR